jgi:hypothetical protein
MRNGNPEGEQGRTYGALRNKDVLLYRSPAWDSTSSGGTAISSREAASSALATPVLFLLGDIKHPEREWAYDGQRDWVDKLFVRSSG